MQSTVSEKCEISQKYLPPKQKGPPDNLYLLIVLCEFGEVIEAAIIFLSVLKIFESIHSWVDHVVPEWWAQTHDEAVQILEWMVGRIIKSSQNLVGSERMCVVVRMSLDPKQNWR